MTFWSSISLLWAYIVVSLVLLMSPADGSADEKLMLSNAAARSAAQPASSVDSAPVSSPQGVGRSLDENEPRVLPTRPSANSSAIGALKFLPDGSEVTISCKIVTLVWENRMYIQEMDRSAGIQAVSNNYPLYVSTGSVVSFDGVLVTENYERQIQINSAVKVHYTNVPLPEPLAMKQRSLVGSPLNPYTPGISDNPYLNTVGLRVQTWGIATTDAFVDNTGYWCFYIDDGSRIIDGNVQGDPPEDLVGVRVYAYAPPNMGEFKVVRGVCGVGVRNPVPPEPPDSGPIPFRVIHTSEFDDVFDPGTPGPSPSTGNVTGTVRLVGATEGTDVRIYGVRSSTLVQNVSDNPQPFELSRIVDSGALITASAPGYLSQSRIVHGGDDDIHIELLAASKALHLWSDKDSIRVCSPDIATITMLIRDIEGKGLGNHAVRLTTTNGAFLETGTDEMIANSDSGGYVQASLVSTGAGPGLAHLTLMDYPNQSISVTIAVELTGPMISVSCNPMLIDGEDTSTIQAVLTIDQEPVPGAEIVFTTDLGGFDEAGGDSTYIAQTGPNGIGTATLQFSTVGTARILARYTDQCGNEVLGWGVVARRSLPWQQVPVEYSSPLVDCLIPTPDGSRQVAIVTAEERLVVWDASGTKIWEKNTSGPNNSPSCAYLRVDTASGLDIVLPAENELNVYAYSGADGTPLAGWPTSSKWPFKLVAAAIVDVNLDGSLEVISGDQSCYVFAWNSTGDWKGLGNPDGSFVWRHLTGSSGTAIYGSTVAVGDVTGDGMNEAVVGASYAPDVYVFPGDAWGDHIAPPLYIPGWPKKTDGRVESSPAIGDIDGDGTNDIAVGCDSGNVYFYLSSDGSWRGHRTGGPVKSSPALADIDGNGQLNVIVGSDDGRVYVFDHLGQHLHGWEGGLLLSPQAAPVRSSPAVADITGDGKLEVVVGCSDGFVYAIYSDGRQNRDQLGKLTGPFAHVWCAIPQGWDTAEVLSSPAIDDLNGDGKIDIIVGSTRGLFRFALDTDLVRDKTHMPWPTFHGNNARTGYTGDPPPLRYSSMTGKVTKNGDPVVRSKVHITYADGSPVPQPHSNPVVYRSHVYTVGQAGANQANQGVYVINQLEPGVEYKLRIESTGNPDKIVGPFTAELGLNRIDIQLDP